MLEIAKFLLKFNQDRILLDLKVQSVINKIRINNSNQETRIKIKGLIIIWIEEIIFNRIEIKITFKTITDSKIILIEINATKLMIKINKKMMK